MPDLEFRGELTYEDVYLLLVDTSGYSSIVAFNPRDQSSHVFQLLQEHVWARVKQLCAELSCSHAQIWSWRGDGGLIAIHDDNESIARDVALTAAHDILHIDLEHVREELRRIDAAGDLRLRIGVHKGTIRYPANGNSGSIHSPEINFAAHLEEATPPDCISISEEVYRAAGRHAEAFQYVGRHENRGIYLRPPTGMAADARRAWLTTAGLDAGAPLLAYPERPSQQEKARLIGVAHTDVIDLGTALHTSASYLMTTERPARYRDAVLDLLRRGGTYRCVLLDPLCEATAILSEYRQENLVEKIRGSIADFTRFKQRYGSAAERFEVYQARAFPGFAAIAVDVQDQDAIILYSPYLMCMKPLGISIEHGDSPHYLVTSASAEIHSSIAELVRTATDVGYMKRVL